MVVKLAAQVALLATRDRAFAVRDKRSSGQLGTWPSVVLAGGQRCGTTSLATWLHENDIARLGSRKELHFFNRYLDFGTEWYQRQLPAHDGLDASASYLSATNSHDQMGVLLPKTTRIVVVVRDPQARAVSHYRYQRQRRYEWRSFSAAQSDEEAGFAGIPEPMRRSAARHFSYVAAGCYGRHIQNLRRAAPEHQLLVLDFGRLFAGDATERQLLLDFLEVTSTALSPFPVMNTAKPGDGVHEVSSWARSQWHTDQRRLEDAANRSLW